MRLWNGRRISGMSLLTAVCSASLLTAGCSTEAVQQAEITPFQTETATCTECRIELEKVVTLGSADGPGGLPEMPGSISTDSRGQFYVLPRRSGEMPIVFSPTGDFVGRIGTEGEGPGEMVRPSRIFVTPGDSLMVLDHSVGRVTVFDPAWQYVRSFPMTWPQADMVRLEDSRFVINGPVGTPDNVGYALHRLDHGGQIALSFEPYVTTPREPTWMRTIGLGPSGLWSIPFAHGHYIRLFDPEDGALLREFTRDSEWYPPTERFQVPTPEDPPSSLMAAVWEEPRGRLWTIGWTHREDWADGLGEPVGTPDGEVYLYQHNDVYDGVIEVIDAETGALIVSARTNGPPSSVIAPGLIAFTHEDSVGWWYADVYRLRLSRP